MYIYIWRFSFILFSMINPNKEKFRLLLFLLGNDKKRT